MWYILYMNKDVVYIEPEDDITNIITKIEKSKSKIVALVPPKKAGILRSIVNIKLIAKAAAAAEKTVVLVTVDPSIVKLAAAAKLPVTKNLQSPPSVPTLEAEESITKEELREPTEEPEAADEESAEADSSETTDEDETANEDEAADEAEAPTDKASAKDAEKKAATKKAKEATGKNKFVTWFNAHKKVAIFGGLGALALILILVWALVIAPAATLTIEVKTDLNNFSESVSFTTKLTEENASEGKFYLEEKKIESVKKVEFEATGQKNMGKEATGEIQVYAYFPLNIKASTSISEGETFTISGLVFKATKSETLSYSGEGKNECANKDNSEGLVDYGCRINGTVSVIASEPGSKYNIAASSTGWDTNARVFAYSDSAMEGGTDDIITIVSPADVEKAKSELNSVDEAKNKADLLDEVGDNLMPIDASFVQSSADAVVSPAVGEKVEEGVKPTLTATTTASIYVIDKTKVEEFITEKAKINDDQKIYKIKDPFIENFMATENGFGGKLKTAYTTGANITENSVIEIVKGKGLGEAQHDLRDIPGITVRIDPSFPWVTSIPNNPNKITVIIEVKDSSADS